VLILDCCFSGGLPGATLPDSKPFSVFTSSPKRMLISSGGRHDKLTPFTAKLVEALGEGVSRHEYVTVLTLGTRLDELAAEPENTSRDDPWYPRQVSSGAGAETVLSLALKGPRYPLRQRLRRWWRWTAGHLALLWGWPFGRGRPAWPNRVVGALLVLALVAAGVLTGVRLTRDEPCPPPLELRMVTAPEEVEAMTGLVETYEREAFDGCRQSRIGVYGARLDTLAEAFERSGNWGSEHSAALSTAGPQPDVWLAQSSVDVDFVRGRLAGLKNGQDEGKFLWGSPVASDPLVLVLTEEGRRRLGLRKPTGQSGTTSWPELRSRLSRAEKAGKPVRLLRPNPTVSGTGLVHTLGMYSEKTPQGQPFREGHKVLGDDKIRSLETEVIAHGRSLTDSAGALCELARGSASGALVSKRQAIRQATCAHAAPKSQKTHRYEIEGLPELDYPLMRVDWLATDRKERDAAIEHFRDWILGDGRNAREEAGYGGSLGITVDFSQAALENRLDRFRAAHPDLRLSVLFDVSGSMRQRERFATASAAVEAALGRLGADDSYELRTFPAGPDGRGSTHLVRDWNGTASDRFPLTADALRPADERQADLVQSLRQTAESLPRDGADRDHQYAILLVTDGDFLRGKSPRVAELRELARELGADGIPVLVASMRPYGCSDTPPEAAHEPGTIANASGGECSPLSADLPTRLSGQVAALTEGRRS
jgi:hypothetical protein